MFSIPYIMSPPSPLPVQPRAATEPIPDLPLPEVNQANLKERQTLPATPPPSIATTSSSTTTPEIPCPLPPLTPAHAAAYLRFAQNRYPDATIREIGQQGRCSLTFVVHDRAVTREDDEVDEGVVEGERGSGSGSCSGSSRGEAFILQFRPPRHKIELDITQAARRIWGELVPVTRYVGVVRAGGSEEGVAEIMETEGEEEKKKEEEDDDDDEERETATADEPGTSITVLPSNPQDDDHHPKNPTTTLIAYTHTLLPGTPLSSLYTTSTTTTRNNTPLEANLHPLLKALAKSYFPPAFHASVPASSPHLPVVKRAVGWTVRRQLRRLERGLPERFGGVVKEIEGGLEEIEEGLPWVLTHGDFIGGGNVLVDVSDGGDRGDGDSDGDGEGERDQGSGVRLTGLVDWAEGEWLPFGVGLYGVEEVLGRVVEVEEEVENQDRAEDEAERNDRNANISGTRPKPKTTTKKTTKKFEYLPNADALRATFWEALTAEIPELADPVFRRRVEKARVLGLLLWYGIAFDDGALNRVAQEGEDEGELQKLDLFLFGSGSGSESRENRGAA
ncbi:hypothetical protein B0J18DRAFT_457146 [Chaetomium sp. MPI-SDFR-AT-0129]|nr:hypothetical protein B0J18DRAFT_457146 [Chaetomium sp. MPI-SDFR-AT-0129]